MYCTKCGAQINDSADICINCGCETIKRIQKQETESFQQTEKNLRLIFGIILIGSFFIGIVIGFSYALG